MRGGRSQSIRAMSTGIPTTYHHIQRAPLCVIVYAAAITLAISAYFASEQKFISIQLYVVAAIVGVLGSGFHYLAISDGGDFLKIRFGPVPLFRRTVFYDDIRTITIGRTTLLEGWGIHWSLGRRGWVWNLWGRDCVILGLRRGTLCLGTDDAQGLLAFLKGQLTLRAIEKLGF